MDDHVDQIRALAQAVRRTADDLREEAAAMTRRVEAVPWSGRAAEAMRVTVGLQVVELGRSARRHDDAAVALDDHAQRVEEVLSLLPSLGGIAHAVWDFAA